MKNNYGDGYAALLATCGGFTPKQIGIHLVESGLWADKTFERAEQQVRECLSRSKNQFFKLSEIIEIMKLTEKREILNFMCEQLGLEHPKELSCRSQLHKLNERLTLISEELIDTSRVLTRLQETADKEAATPTNPELVRYSRETIHDEEEGCCMTHHNLCSPQMF